MGTQVISRIEVCQRSPKSDLLQSPFPGRIHKLLPHFKTEKKMAGFGVSLLESFKSLMLQETR
jgi:hypothetical protein